MTTSTVQPRTAQARPAQAAADQRAQWLGLGRTLALDTFGPIALHSLLTRHGWTEANALMLSGSLPLVGILSDKVRGRRVGGLSVLVLGGIVLAVAIGLVTHDARSVLLEGGLSSAGAGLFALVTLWTRRTMVELFLDGGTGGEHTDKGRRARELFTREDVRRFARTLTLGLALVFFASAAVQLVLASVAPIDVAFAYNRFGFVPCLAVLAGIAVWLYRRARARGELADISL